MGKRLSKIYTRTGDAGDTGLGDGSRIKKTHPRVEAIGTVDELNSLIGLLIEGLAQEESLSSSVAFLSSSQHRLFDLGGELSMPGQHDGSQEEKEEQEPYVILTPSHVADIEVNLDALNQHLEPLVNFIMPGGSELIARCHLARAVCRRAERRVIALAELAPVNPHSVCYLNRMSDYLFVLARSCAAATGRDEVLWQQDPTSSA